MSDLPADFLDELRAANGKLINEISGPNRTQLQFWAVRRRGMVLVQLFPEGGVEVFRSVEDSSSIAATLGAFRAYLHTGAEPG